MRHAQTNDNLVKRYTGNNDKVGINREGKNQLENLIPFFKSRKIRTIFSSPFRRCLETSLFLKKPLGIELIADGNLREVYYGQWQGLTSAEAQEKFPQIFKARGENPAHIAPPGGETLLQMQQRVLKTIQKITSSNKNSLVITHGSCIHAVLMYFQKIDLTNFWDFTQKHKLVNCSISEIFLLKNSVRVGKIGWMFGEEL